MSEILERTIAATPADDMAAALIGFINQSLPEIHTRLPARLHVDRHTPLFESGLIDSMAILHLMAYVERMIGRRIPPRMVVMKHFRTVESICQAFHRLPKDNPDASGH